MYIARQPVFGRLPNGSLVFILPLLHVAHWSGDAIVVVERQSSGQWQAQSFPVGWLFTISEVSHAEVRQAAPELLLNGKLTTKMLHTLANQYVQQQSTILAS